MWLVVKQETPSDIRGKIWKTFLQLDSVSSDHTEAGEAPPTDGLAAALPSCQPIRPRLCDDGFRQLTVIVTEDDDDDEDEDELLQPT